MPDTYEVQAPDGKTLEIQSDRPPTPQDALRAIRAYGDHQAAAAQARAEAGSTVGAALRPLAQGALDALPGIGAVVGGVLSTPETGGIGTVPGIALGAGAGRGVRDMIAAGVGMEKPSTAGGEAARIGGETALTGATAAVLPGVVSALRTPIQTMREGVEQFSSAMPPAVRRLGNLFPALPRSAAPVLERPAWQTWGESPGTLRTSAPAGTASTAPLSDLELARQEVAAGRLPQSALAAIERAQQAAPKTPPGMIRTSSPPITVAPESPMQPAAENPMQQPRVQVGAEVVGRQNGLSKESVRQQTGPLFNEAPGQASPVVPQTPFERMHDKLLGMGPGNPAREAYVQAAKDPKTAGQLEILRRTLERNGLSVAAATSMAEAMRQAVMKRLQGDQP